MRRFIYLFFVVTLLGLLANKSTTGNFKRGECLGSPHTGYGPGPGISVDNCNPRIMRFNSHSGQVYFSVMSWCGPISIPVTKANSRLSGYIPHQVLSNCCNGYLTFKQTPWLTDFYRIPA